MCQLNNDEKKIASIQLVKDEFPISSISNKLKIKVTYEDGKYVIVDVTEDMINGDIDFKKAGTYDIEITYKGVKEQFDVKINGYETITLDSKDNIEGIEQYSTGNYVSYKEENLMMYNGNPVYFTPDFPIRKGSAFSCGVTIGEIRKNYIQPHHQFFMAMGTDFKRKIELTADSDEIKKYLHGEEFNTDCPNGWAVVLVDSCTVGGVKVSNGKAKNHYPKGLRTK